MTEPRRSRLEADPGRSAAGGERHPLRALQERINAALEEMWEKIGKHHHAVSGRAAPGLSEEVPAEADLSRDEEAVHLEIELPGLDESDIEVRVDGDMLSVRGEKALEREVAERTYHLSERAYGRIVRSFLLPPDVDPERATASYRTGVLSVTVPRRAEARVAARRIKIEAR